ncbi:MAG: hypothetical protein AAF573_02260, partial [Bacteroidota bacterium]
EFRKKIETWFDDSMDELKGVYRQRSQLWIGLISIVVTISLNVDSIRVAQFLYQNPNVREQLADSATKFIRDSSKLEQVYQILEEDTTSLDSVDLEKLKEQVRNIGEFSDMLKSSYLPIGWNFEKDDEQKEKEFPNSEKSSSHELGEWLYLKWLGFLAFIKMMAGWLMTAFAVTLGAPFWFDLLNRLTNLRAAGQDPSAQTNSTTKQEQPVG